MSLTRAEALDLPPLQDMISTHKLAIGDVAMFAAMSDEGRQQEVWADMYPVLEPYVVAGVLTVKQTVVTNPHLRAVK